jgi:hypothetical protein
MMIGPSPTILIDYFPKGSACCVWQDATQKYLLTASHVVDDVPPFTPLLWMDRNAEIGEGHTLEAVTSPKSRYPQDRCVEC